MEEAIRTDILAVLEQAVIALKENNTFLLSELSNHIIHNATIYQDEDSISTAILVYSLGKVVQRCIEKNCPYDTIAPQLQTAKECLRLRDLKCYNENIKKTFDTIRKLDNRLSQFITEVLEKAKINKASKIYQHGISSARTAQMLGITQWELMSYLGQTTTPKTEGISAVQRLKFAESLFR